MLAFHVGAIAALFMFSWKNLAIAVFLWWLTGSMGIGMCYHRLLTHRGYKTPRWLEYWMAICGTMALEGGPIAWVATHRIHHQNTDKEGDPHSPNDGGLWAHMGWIITGKAMHQNTAELLPYVPDLRKQKFYMWISKYHWVPLAVLGVILLAIGGGGFVFFGGVFFGRGGGFRPRGVLYAQSPGGVAPVIFQNYATQKIFWWGPPVVGGGAK